jgi:hypothetical protein
VTRHWFFCGERACPALGGKAAPTPSRRSTRYTEGNGFGSAAQPSGGQAPLPQRSMQHPGTRCQHRLFLWRAGLPRAGRQSRPNTLTTFYQIHRGGWFWVCCAAQRGTSPLATEGYAAAWNSLPTTGFSCGERACPALGGNAAPTPSPRSTRYTEGAGFGSATQPSGGQAPLPQRALQQPATCCPPLAFLWRAGLPRAGRQSRPNSLTKSCQIHRGGLSLLARGTHAALSCRIPGSAPASVRSRSGLALCVRCSSSPGPCRSCPRRSTAPAGGRSTSR